MAAQVRCGSASTPMGDQWVGMSVRDVRMKLGRTLSIPDGAPATVSRDGGSSSSPVPESYTVQTGDLVEFVRAPGTKGQA